MVHSYIIGIFTYICIYAFSFLYVQFFFLFKRENQICSCLTPLAFYLGFAGQTAAALHVLDKFPALLGPE